MNKKFLIALTVLGLIGVNAAIFATDATSQVVAVPQVQTINPTADRIQVIPNGSPSAQSVYASPAQITAVKNYYYSVPASLFTYTFSNNMGVASFNPAGTLAYGYVTMAPNPSDGTEACVFSSQTITTLYLQANTSQSITNAVTTLAANAKVCYIYSLANLTWRRTQ